MPFLFKRVEVFVWINGIISRIFSPFMELKDFRDKKSSKVEILASPEIITINLSNYFFNGSAYWKNFTYLKSDGLFYAHIANANIISKGIVVDSEKRIILESTIFQREYLNRLHSNHLVYFQRFLPKRKVGKVISLLNKLDNNYFHWTLESLTRILLIYDKPFFKDYKILVKDGALPFVKKSLCFLFNISESHIITKTLGENMEAEQALVISFPHIRNTETQLTNIYIPSVIKNLNALAHKRLQPSCTERKNLPKNFIISRKKALSRRILNEEKLIEHLTPFNFESIVLETLSYEEQVALFAGAEKIISMHGAGITNIIYAKNPILVEIFPEERNIRDAFYFAQITAALGIEHHLFLIKTENEKQDVLLNGKMLHKIKKIFCNH